MDVARGVQVGDSTIAFGGRLRGGGRERAGKPRRRDGDERAEDRLEDEGEEGGAGRGDDEGDERALGEAGEGLQGGGVDGGGVAREVGRADAEEEDVLGAAPGGPRDACDGDEGPRRAREARNHAVTEAGGPAEAAAGDAVGVAGGRPPRAALVVIHEDAVEVVAVRVPGGVVDAHGGVVLVVQPGRCRRGRRAGSARGGARAARDGDARRAGRRDRADARAPNRVSTTAAARARRRGRGAGARDPRDDARSRR